MILLFMVIEWFFYKGKFTTYSQLFSFDPPRMIEFYGFKMYKLMILWSCNMIIKIVQI